MTWGPVEEKRGRKDMFYKQCTLRHEKTSSVRTSWIPEQFAKEGKILDIKEGEHWVKGWKVVDVFTRASEEYVVEHERDYKTQRKASDI